jgi:hypothetical protein
LLWRRYAGGVSYAQGDGVDATGRARHEALRMQAAEMFGDGVVVEEVARRLRVSVRVRYDYRRRDALVSVQVTRQTLDLVERAANQMAEGSDHAIKMEQPPAV